MMWPGWMAFWCASVKSRCFINRAIELFRLCGLFGLIRLCRIFRLSRLCRLFRLFRLFRLCRLPPIVPYPVLFSLSWSPSVSFTLISVTIHFTVVELISALTVRLWTVDQPHRLLERDTMRIYIARSAHLFDMAIVSVNPDRLSSGKSERLLHLFAQAAQRHTHRHTRTGWENGVHEIEGKFTMLSYTIPAIYARCIMNSSYYPANRVGYSACTEFTRAT